MNRRKRVEVVQVDQGEGQAGKRGRGCLVRLQAMDRGTVVGPEDRLVLVEWGWARRCHQ